jgi:aldehyde:ferredoxin oxidoreductase
MLKYVRVNVKTKEIFIEERPAKDCLLGGRALIADFMTKEVEPTCDPLGGQNKIIFCTSMLAGSGLSTALRLSVGAKSPLTLGIKESNSGGTVASAMAKTNIKAIIFEELPDDDKWFYLHVNKTGDIELLPADDYLGSTTYEFVDQMNMLYGNGIAFAGIGPAGEQKYANASIQNTDNGTGFPCRAAARGGLGAVLGTKQIKGIVFEKTRGGSFEAADPEALEKAKKIAMDNLMTHPVCGLSMTGTLANVDPHAEDGTFPNRNFSGKPITPEELDKIGISKYLQDIQDFGGKTGVACQPGCVIRCSNVYNDVNKGELTAAIEYETVGLCGSNLGIYDLQFVGKMDYLCDNLGMDTIEVGCTIGVLMEAGELEFGDKEGVLALMDEMAKGTDFGHELGKGTKYIGEKYQVARTPQCNGQGMPAYDPRAKKGLGITFESGAMGADHTAGTTAFAFVDPFKLEENVFHSNEQQTFSAIYDSFMCMFGWYAFGFESHTRQMLADLINAMYGVQWTDEDMIKFGMGIRKQELAYNALAGKTLNDSKLPDFFYSEVNQVSGHTYDWTDEARKAFIETIQTFN